MAKVEIGGLIIDTDKPMPQRLPHDFYPTPQTLADRAVGLLRADHHTILDPGAGAGVWGIAARKRWPHAHIEGVELREVAKPDAYDQWHTAAFADWHNWHGYSAIIGNPPYKFAESFVRRAWSMLHTNGEMVLLLRLAFLESVGRYRGLWQEMPPAAVHICVNRVSFTGNNRTDATAYGLFHWRKDNTAAPILQWFDWKAA